jgi:chemotaxis protein MotB
MARKKKHPEHENHERWLVSYADFITLLFAFFVVMFATSQADKGKAQQVSDSIKKALEGEKVGAMIAAVLGGTVGDTGQGNAMTKGPGGVKEAPKVDKKKEEPDKKEQKLAELAPSLKVLTEALALQIHAGKIQVSMQQRGLVISFTQAALFPSAEDVISPGAYDGIRMVAEAVRRIPNPVRLEGHTDSRPIRNSNFQSNWELSAARSIAVLNILTERYAVPHERLSVAGYADTAPIAPNDTEEGRAKNRRVDIVILNEQGVKAEPLKIGE